MPTEDKREVTMLIQPTHECREALERIYFRQKVARNYQVSCRIFRAIRMNALMFVNWYKRDRIYGEWKTTVMKDNPDWIQKC